MELFDKKQLDGIAAQMQLRRETIAVAESVTSGLLQLTLAQAEQASTFYQGGISVYNLGQKYRHLNVEPIHALAVNCVSAKVSEEMALNVRNLFNSDWGIGVTGYATPVPESGNRTFAFYTIAYKGQVTFSEELAATGADAFEVQSKYVTEIIAQLEKQLANKA